MNKIKEMKYKIYHIKGVKIGVTDNVKRRIMYYKEVILSDVEVLEEHTDIYKVSDREIELQREYGYPVDKIPYWQTIKNGTKEGNRKGGKIGGKISGKITGKKHVESGHIQRIAIARSTPIVQYTKSGEFIKEFISQTEASRQLNLDIGNINKVIKGKRKTLGGFVFKYANELAC